MVLIANPAICHDSIVPIIAALGLTSAEGTADFRQSLRLQKKFNVIFDDEEQFSLISPAKITNLKFIIDVNWVLKYTLHRPVLVVVFVPVNKFTTTELFIEQFKKLYEPHRESFHKDAIVLACSVRLDGADGIDSHKVHNECRIPQKQVLQFLPTDAVSDTLWDFVHTFCTSKVKKIRARRIGGDNPWKQGNLFAKLGLIMEMGGELLNAIRYFEQAYDFVFYALSQDNGTFELHYGASLLAFKICECYLITGKPANASTFFSNHRRHYYVTSFWDKLTTAVSQIEMLNLRGSDALAFAQIMVKHSKNSRLIRGSIGNLFVFAGDDFVTMNKQIELQPTPVDKRISWRHPGSLGYESTTEEVFIANYEQPTACYKDAVKYFQISDHFSFSRSSLSVNIKLIRLLYECNALHEAERYADKAFQKIIDSQAFTIYSRQLSLFVDLFYKTNNVARFLQSGLYYLQTCQTEEKYDYRTQLKNTMRTIINQTTAPLVVLNDSAEFPFKLSGNFWLAPDGNDAFLQVHVTNTTDFILSPSRITVSFRTPLGLKEQTLTPNAEIAQSHRVFTKRFDLDKKYFHALREVIIKRIDVIDQNVSFCNQICSEQDSIVQLEKYQTLSAAFAPENKSHGLSRAMEKNKIIFTSNAVVPVAIKKICFHSQTPFTLDKSPKRDVLTTTDELHCDIQVNPSAPYNLEISFDKPGLHSVEMVTTFLAETDYPYVPESRSTLLFKIVDPFDFGFQINNTSCKDALLVAGVSSTCTVNLKARDKLIIQSIDFNPVSAEFLPQNLFQGSAYLEPDFSYSSLFLLTLPNDYSGPAEVELGTITVTWSRTETDMSIVTVFALDRVFVKTTDLHVTLAVPKVLHAENSITLNAVCVNNTNQVADLQLNVHSNENLMYSGHNNVLSRVQPRDVKCIDISFTASSCGVFPFPRIDIQSKGREEHQLVVTCPKTISVLPNTEEGAVSHSK